MFVLNVLFVSICLRNENLYGKDTIRVSTMNRNGKNNLNFPIFVEPINDPPFVNVPSFIVYEDSRDEVLISYEQKDTVDFFIGDPDLLNFPGMLDHIPYYVFENQINSVVTLFILVNFR